MKPQQNGFTLMEMVVTMAIVAVLASIAVPSFSSIMANRQVQGAAEKIYQDMLWARSESVKSNTNITLSVVTGSNWCYGFSDSGACSCGTAGSCTVDGVDKRVTYDSYSNSSLATAGTLSMNGANFEPVRGTLENGSTMTDGSISFTRSSTSATVKINPIGKPSICSSSLSDYPNC